MDKVGPTAGHPNLRLDERAGVFLLADRPVPLTANTLPFEALAYLYRRPGEIVWADELIAHLYGDRAVAGDVSEEQRLEKHISRIRRALGPGAGYLVTIRRGPTRPTGYKLELLREPRLPAPSWPVEPRRSLRVPARKVLALTALLALVIAAVFGSDAIRSIATKSGDGPRITGTVRSAVTGQPLAGVRVHALGGQPCCTTLSYTDTDAQGRYVLAVPQGEVIVQFSPDPRRGYVWEYWDGRKTMFTSTFVSAREGTVTGIDAVLETGPRIVVRVTDAAGRPTPAVVRVYAASSGTSDFVAGTFDGSDGTYELRLGKGSYRIGLYPEKDDCCEGPPVIIYDLSVDGTDQTVAVTLP